MITLDDISGLGLIWLSLKTFDKLVARQVPSQKGIRNMPTDFVGM